MEVESTVESTKPETWSGKVKVTWSSLKDRAAKKVMINLPATIHPPAGEYHIILSKANGVTRPVVESTNHTVESTKESTLNSTLLKKLVLLMVRAGINSEEHDIQIDEGDVSPIIEQLQQEGAL